MSRLIESRLNLARMVVQRLARLSVDSRWARIASGYRGGLIKTVEQLESMSDPESVSDDYLVQTDFLINKGLDLLAKAARDMGDPELARFAGQSQTQLKSLGGGDASKA